MAQPDNELPFDGRVPFDLTTLPDGERSFHEQFLAWGSTAPATVKEAYHRLVATGKVRTLFFEDRRFDAFAKSTGDDHFIALSIAIPSLLMFVFNNVLRLDSVFRDIGDPTAEARYRSADDRRPIPLRLPATITPAEALLTLPGASRPFDDKRALAAVALTEIAGAFCVFHEIGHVIGGHTAFLAARFGVASVAEFSGTSQPFYPHRLMRQCLEREADIIAAVMTMSFVLNDPGTRLHFQECFGLIADEGEYPYHVFSIVLFALKLLFLYHAQLQARFDTDPFHPHPLIRSTYVHATMRITAADDLGLEIDLLDQLLDAATDQADHVWEDLGLQVPALSRYKSGPRLAKIVEREIVRLEEAHRQLQPHCAPWSWLDESVWKERSV